ncbi:uncharacterized protein EI90DRAFT_3291557 [Cantharellus anzutake]|uniref:uncharacterized protein n=1 Tax=Cantharellus anzutake TaxID=1750568 RepID=UPI001903211B|nr:uncharacterized protein EI90DRAFT_3291557 [Cantharellus anzutake]KAF8326107.1 hypothetical protein EI90DRAFT_3291557 [Cantharellus anzutake]
MKAFALAVLPIASSLGPRWPLDPLSGWDGQCPCGHSQAQPRHHVKSQSLMYLFGWPEYYKGFPEQLELPSRLSWYRANPLPFAEAIYFPLWYHLTFNLLTYAIRSDQILLSGVFA